LPSRDGAGKMGRDPKRTSVETSRRSDRYR
jgi:hypothetical protein